MNYLAIGLALTIVHIEKRSDACSEDGDVRALEEIVGHPSWIAVRGRAPNRAW